ncbi:MAG: Lrp/AsnC family transcriptional regulator [Magnetococcales bacterium]|nr:Lrp/AsnC family transcriptional regulator [Magnetococcales bacterium]NGZ25302.1 Lrp/AsnC family transcriptional regulator [Magnetococcales bacterium]
MGHRIPCPQALNQEQVVPLTSLQRRLLDLYQHEFPLTSRPYQHMAAEVGGSEAEVMASLGEMMEKGVLSRVGVVLTPRRVGCSTLAAMAVPLEDLERVAALVTARPEVNHNYERENRLNLWFVITASDGVHLQQVMGEIEAASGYPVAAFPMEEDFHIDLGFPLDWQRGESTWTPS